MTYEEIIAEGVLSFGLTPEEVGNLTYFEFNVMMERYNEKKKDEYEILRNVALNAIINGKRKGNKLIPLFEKTSGYKDTDDILEEREELFNENPFE